MAAGPYWLAVVLVMLLSTGLGGWAVLRGAVARRMADQAA
jgi:hypothetical protein